MSENHQRQVERELAEEARTPEAIEWEIQRTRERMTSNLDELGDRFSPEHLKRQAKDALSGKAQDVAASVQDQARETRSHVMEFIRQHPLPVVAASLGAIWLFGPRKGGARIAASAVVVGLAFRTLRTDTDAEGHITRAAHRFQDAVTPIADPSV